MAEAVRYKPGQARKKPIRKPYSSAPSYVDFKDRQGDTENFTVKPASTTATTRATGNYPSASSASGPRASSTGSVAGTPSATARTEPAEGDKWDGFAGRYVPGERDLLFGNPDIIVRDWLSQGKYKGNDQMAGDMSRYANIFFGDDSHGGLYELLTGGSLNPKAIGDDDQINALVDLLGQQSKVGGRSPSVEKMLSLLFEGFSNKDSTMGGLLNAQGGDDATTGQAINAIMQYIPLLGEFTGNRRYSDAIYRQAQSTAQDYMDRQVKGENKGSVLDWFKQNFM
jgi:hypothetical protein